MAGTVAPEENTIPKTESQLFNFGFLDILRARVSRKRHARHQQELIEDIEKDVRYKMDKNRENEWMMFFKPTYKKGLELIVFTVFALGAISIVELFHFVLGFTLFQSILWFLLLLTLSIVLITGVILYMDRGDRLVSVWHYSDSMRVSANDNKLCVTQRHQKTTEKEADSTYGSMMGKDAYGEVVGITPTPKPKQHSSQSNDSQRDVDHTL